MSTNPELRFLCFICNMPKFLFELETFKQRYVCRACINYEGIRITFTFDKANYCKEQLQQSHANTMPRTSDIRQPIRQQNTFSFSVPTQTPTSSQINRQSVIVNNLRPRPPSYRFLSNLTPENITCTPDLIRIDNTTDSTILNGSLNTNTDELIRNLLERNS